MRAACSLLLSISLLFPSALLASTQTTQDKNTKQAAQEPQPVAPVVKQPLAFGLEDATPVKLRINRSYLINDFVAAKPQTGRNGIRRKVMIWLSFNGFIL